jgi:threonine aldolase
MAANFGAGTVSFPVLNGTGLRELTSDAGVDIISLGATKNGAMMAEAVIVPPTPNRT